MSTTGADILLDVFKSHGVEYIFCSPGSEWFPVWESLIRRYNQDDKTLKYINCRHEVLAISMASGYAHATGRLPAVLLHASVGTLNGAMTLRMAYRAKSPMIVCSGDTYGYGEDEDDKGDAWKWIGGLSEMGGTDALVRPYVKWSNAVTSKETILDSVYRGCEIAQKVPQGPVFLNIPWEFLLKSLPEANIRPPTPPAPPQPNHDDLKFVAEQLMSSKQPIILTEHAGERPGAVSKLVELAELLSIPVFESIYPRFANFPREHPLHIGYDTTEVLHEADVIFIVGGTTPWQPPSAFPRSAKKVILLDEEPLKERLPYWGYRIDLPIAADTGQWLTALVDTINTRLSKSGNIASHYRERFERWQAKHQQLRKKWEEAALAKQRNKPISPEWLFYTANKVLPSNSFILAETATHSAIVQRYMAEPESFLKVISGGLGNGLGAAAGIKLARKDRPVVLIVGDGTFSYNPVLAGLGLYQEYQLPVMVIVLNNGAYASMRSTHQKYYPKGWAVSKNTYLGVDLTPVPNYTKVAEAFDVYGYRLENPDDVEPTLNRALQQITSGKSVLIDVILDPKETSGYASIGGR
ncbi:thiamine pyrophosphate-dependent enzyme [Chloroflexota bacterium]